MLKAAKTSSSSMKLALRLQADQLKRWITIGKDPDEIYKFYDLNYAAYTNTFSIENPDKVTRLLSTLATQFSDRPMIQILQAAEKFPSLEIVAAKLQLQQAEKIFSTGI
ncbi:hypothetical protein V7S43_004066 [Phytophthora oleae]|uniref:RXLR phytopathogen effector protein WY-domain domain-containing protein n=1 Tax=Phytophthora oleae TaxID=2107226 RepID=A0ABD3FWU1_9STRA